MCAALERKPHYCPLKMTQTEILHLSTDLPLLISGSVVLGMFAPPRGGGSRLLVPQLPYFRPDITRLVPLLQAAHPAADDFKPYLRMKSFVEPPLHNPQSRTVLVPETSPHHKSLADASSEFSRSVIVHRLTWMHQIGTDGGSSPGAGSDNLGLGNLCTPERGRSADRPKSLPRRRHLRESPAAQG